ncbi:hypothetical protein [Thermosyntropha sp.]|uniref:hypothetical protein n=1 Tax=Thermosyntropha sp. TaxID=2740820 RepID=UPI0025EBEAD7|nr:hypothetical protein [Thermosyntropha sp.]
MSNEYADCIFNRKIMPVIYETPTYFADKNLKSIYNILRKDLAREFGEDKLLFDSPDKVIHKIPQHYKLDDEKAIPVWVPYGRNLSTIIEESLLIRNMAENIDLRRIYVKEDIAGKAKEFIKERIRDMED